ncbi:RodZ domain-containing protein [Shewanella morhuae]|uniref:Cytoskeleton protein rodZ n=1 Tax=Shewanella morhuae TaxID=365591 RepID=A0A380A903_9GAMM|nr:RodZ domain-containing protein [Shewanella morhuae]GIU07640.1 membrane protein [Shewanella morhuae]SUI76122.1 Cytoskeleton protein rodZ [Shewanella morhuae]
MKDHETHAPVESLVTESIAPDVTLGTLLRHGREKMGLSLQEAAVKLHLRPSVLEDIEADNFTNIASPTYTRGYVKNYARMVHADTSLIEAGLLRQVPVATEPSMQSFSRKTTYQASDKRLTWLSIFIVIVLLGLLVVWWMQKSTLLTTVDLSQPTAEEVAAVNQTLPGDVLLTETDASQQLTEIAANGSMSIDGPIKDTDASTIDISTGPTDNNYARAADTNNEDGGSVIAATTTTSQTAPIVQQPLVASTPAPIPVSPATNTNTVAVVEGQSTIDLQLSGDCWINIVDAKGKALVDGVKGAGAVVQVSGMPPFKIILGAPHVATLSLDGQIVNLADFPKGRVARLTLPKV